MIKEDFFDKLEKHYTPPGEMIMTSYDWRDGDGKQGGFIHIGWNDMCDLYWEHSKQYRRLYIQGAVIFFILGIAIGFFISFIVL